MAVTLSTVWTIGLAAALVSGALGAQEARADRCVFAGTARNRATMLGLGKVSIRLVPENGSVGYAASSGVDGNFRFEGVAPGDYQVVAQRTGYSSPWVLVDQSGHAIAGVHLAAGDTLAGNSLWFTPDGAISGRVTGQDGEPIADAHITLIEQKWRHGKRVYAATLTRRADDSGVYRCSGVRPGRYFVFASGPREGPLGLSMVDGPGQPERRIAGRYHPDAAQLDGASAIVLRAGEELSGVDFTLPLVPVFHLTGSAERTVQGASADSRSVGLERRYRDQALEWDSNSAALGKDGTFDLAGVTAGDYFLYSAESTGSNSLVSIKAPVTMPAEDRTGAVAPAVSRFAGSGRVRVEGAPGEGRIAVQIFFEGSQADEFTSYQRHVQPDADGTFVAPDLTPDRYAIRIANLDTGKAEGYYLKAVLLSGVAAPGGEIDLAGGPAENLELVLSDATGSAEGTVQWPAESSTPSRKIPDPVAELTIAAIPEKLASGSTRPLTAYLDQDGHFRLSDLEPGVYRLFALTNYDSELWRNPEFQRQIAGSGALLEVTAGASARLELTVLPAERVRQVEERIE